jgi:hypothetical protein
MSRTALLIGERGLSEAHTRTTAVFGDELDACGFEGLSQGVLSRLVGTEKARFAFKTLDGWQRHGRCHGEGFLLPP